MPVFLDTVGLIALWERSDQWHQPASVAFLGLLRSGTSMVTTPQVLMECGNASARRPCRTDVVRLRHDLIAAGGLVVPSGLDEDAAWAALERGDAARAGIVDQISFVVMGRLGITRIFTNDGHFRAAGFETVF